MARTDASADRGPLRPIEWVVFWVALALVVTAVLIGAWAAWTDGYVTLADDVEIASHAAAVFSSDTPLLGMPASTERFAGVVAHHPGPLLFWAYAPFVELLGQSAGLLVGAAAVNIAGVVGCGVAALRRGGLSTGLLGLAAAAAALVVFGGPAGTFRPVNSVAVNVVFVAFVLMSWGVSCGDRKLVPWWILAGSLVVQAELIFLVQVVGVGALAVGLGVHRARRAGPRPDAGRSLPTPVPRANLIALGVVGVLSTGIAARWSGSLLLAVLGAAAVGGVAIVLVRRSSVARFVVSDRSLALWVAVGLVAWSFPLLDALGSGGGNVSALWGYLRTDIAVWGAEGARAAVRISLLPPTGPLTPLRFASGSWWVPAAVAVAGAALALAGGARRQQRRHVLALASAAVVLAALAASQAPVEEGFQFQHLGWLPLIAVVVWFALAVSSLDVAARWLPPIAATTVGAIAVLLCVYGALRQPDTWGLQPHESWAHEAIADLGEQSRAADLRAGPYGLVSSGSTMNALLLSGLIDQLEQGDLEVLLGPSGAVFGPDRALSTHADSAVGMIYLVPDDIVPTDDLVRIATWSPPDRDGDAVDAVADEVAAVVAADGPVELNDRGRAALGRLAFGRVPGACLVEVDPTCRPLTELPPGDPSPRLLLDLFAEGGIAAPALPPDLAERVRAVTAVPAFQLLSGPVPVGADG